MSSIIAWHRTVHCIEGLIHAMQEVDMKEGKYMKLATVLLWKSILNTPHNTELTGAQQAVEIK